MDLAQDYSCLALALVLAWAWAWAWSFAWFWFWAWCKSASKFARNPGRSRAQPLSGSRYCFPTPSSIQVDMSKNQGCKNKVSNLLTTGNMWTHHSGNSTSLLDHPLPPLTGAWAWASLWAWPRLGLAWSRHWAWSGPGLGPGLGLAWSWPGLGLGPALVVGLCLGVALGLARVCGGPGSGLGWAWAWH